MNSGDNFLSAPKTYLGWVKTESPKDSSNLSKSLVLEHWVLTGHGFGALFDIESHLLDEWPKQAELQFLK